MIFNEIEGVGGNKDIKDATAAQPTRPTDFTTEVALGLRENYGITNKFGFNADVDTGGPEVIASFGDTFSVMTTADTMSVVSSDANDATGGTGATLLLIQGIGADYLANEEYLALNGTTPVTTINSYLGINRVYVVASGSSDMNEGNITLSDTGGTFGNQAQIPVESGVTQQCIFHTAINQSFLLDFINLSAIKISGGGGQPEIIVHGYTYSRVTNTRYEVARLKMDTQRDNNIIIDYVNPISFLGREVIYFTAETDTNNTSVSLRFSGKTHTSS